MTKTVILVVALVGALGLAACGGSPADKVGVGERDFSISLASASIAPGSVDFRVDNTGPSGHELLIFKTDLADGSLPLDGDGRVNEDHGAGITKVFDSGSDTPAGKVRTMHAKLTPGRYVVICNVGNHYRLGMHTALTVT
jgi:hypothetical protein